MQRPVLFFPLAFLLLAACVNEEEPSSSHESSSPKEEAEEPSPSAEHTSNPEEEPTEYIGYNSGQPLFKMNKPENFEVMHDYFTDVDGITFTYQPEDIAYVSEKEYDTYHYDQEAVIEVFASMRGLEDPEAFLQRNKTSTSSDFADEGEAYEVLEADSTDMGPFAYAFQSDKEHYREIEYYGMHEDIIVLARVRIPLETEKIDRIQLEALEAISSLTFDDPASWESRPDKTRAVQEVVYDPVANNEPGAGREDGYSITLPAFPDEFVLEEAFPARLYRVKKTYPSLEKKAKTNVQDYVETDTRFEVFPQDLPSPYFSESEIAQANKEALARLYPEDKVEEVVLLDSSFDMGDFTTGVRVKMETYEEYLFAMETDHRIHIARYNLFNEREDYDELKELYEEAVGTFQLNAAP
ncbi:hypothetical protein ATL39_3044 [Sinobaca qinghaiensis]|uniref:Uncharacterized protein n=1 Tax=Sinobaca qinghaiensis TaxID=342944 RepID=A0A419UWX0_9BACL|nr:hypothetical protein [Sinobaca qinghaiensis]RKD69620.1 hypothetical protein ATL39_3044 [Sinobaca qinghaiensis]